MNKEKNMEKILNPPLGDGGWFLACHVDDMPANGGVCVKYKEEQIALFHFTRQ